MIANEKFRFLIIVSVFQCFFFTVFGQGDISTTAQNNSMKIWMTHPASEWDDAFPVGNGSLGAMIFGGIEQERIQLNEESVWAGRELDYHNPQSQEGLKEVRKLLFEGMYTEAEKVAQEKIMGRKPDEIDSYQTLGDLHLDFGQLRAKGDYRRELNIENATERAKSNILCLA